MRYANKIEKKEFFKESKLINDDTFDMLLDYSENGNIPNSIKQLYKDIMSGKLKPTERGLAEFEMTIKDFDNRKLVDNLLQDVEYIKSGNAKDEFKFLYGGNVPSHGKVSATSSLFDLFRQGINYYDTINESRKKEKQVFEIKKTATFTVDEDTKILLHKGDSIEIVEKETKDSFTVSKDFRLPESSVIIESGECLIIHEAEDEEDDKKDSEKKDDKKDKEDSEKDDKKNKEDDEKEKEEKSKKKESVKDIKKSLKESRRPDQIINDVVYKSIIFSGIELVADPSMILEASSWEELVETIMRLMKINKQRALEFIIDVLYNSSDLK